MHSLQDETSNGTCRLSLRVEQTAAAIIVALTFLCAFFNPIFFDEIAYAVTLGRLHLDDYRRIFIFAQCPSTFSNPVPPDLLPLMLVVDIFYRIVGSLTGLRLLGIGVAVVNSFLLFEILSYFAGASQKRYVCRFVLALTAGLFPILNVMLRPEGLCLLCVLCVIRLGQKAKATGSSRAAIVVGVMTAAAAISAAIHPIGILTAPICIAAVCFCRPAGHWRWLSFAAICYFAMRGYQFHSHYFACPESPEIDRGLKYYAGSLNSDFGAEWILAKVKNTLFTLYLAFALIPHSPYENGYLPGFDPAANEFAVWFAGCLAVGALTLLAWINLRLLRYRLISGTGKKTFSQQSAICIATWVCLLVMCAIQPYKLAHRAILLYPLFLLVTGCGIFTAADGDFSKRWRGVINSIAACAVLSALAVCFLYLPLFLSRQSAASIPDQPISIGRLAPEENKADIEQAKTACGIKNSPESRRLLIDQLTYFAAARSREPIFFGYFVPTSLEEFSAYLRVAEVEGILVNCASIRTDFDLSPVRFGDVCCVPKGQLNKLKTGS